MVPGLVLQLRCFALVFGGNFRVLFHPLCGKLNEPAASSATAERPTKETRQPLRGILPVVTLHMCEDLFSNAGR